MDAAGITSSGSWIAGQTRAAEIAGSALPSDPDAFLTSLRVRVPKGETRTPQEQARAAAEDFVSITFVQPLFKELRATSHAAPPFAPTQAEKQFQGIADEALARKIVKASNWGLVDRIAKDLLKRGRESASPATTHQPSREAAREGSPGRQPWDQPVRASEPRSGDGPALPKDLTA